jgi:hypothetical protein
VDFGSLTGTLTTAVGSLLGFGSGDTAASNDFLSNWTQSSGLFSTLSTSMSALSPPSIIPDTGNAATSCEVLQAYGVVSSCP